MISNFLFSVLERGGFGFFLSTTLTSAGIPLRKITENLSSERYFILLPVLDYARLKGADDSGRIDLLTVDDVLALQSGSAALILDLSNEGPAFEKTIFETLHINLSLRSIPREAVVFLSQNRLLGDDYNASFGAGIRFWVSDYFPMATSIWLDERRGRAFDRALRFDPRVYLPLKRVHSRPRFLSQNAAARWHRILLYRWFQLNDMEKDGLISFHGVGTDNPKGNEIDIDSPPKEIAENFPFLIDSISEWIPRSAKKLGGDERMGNDLVLSIDLECYSEVDLVIVTESDFFRPSIERITEKSIKAAAMGVPFVILGPPNCIRLLRELGFQVFDGLIDHRYDRISDPVARLNAVFSCLADSWEICRDENSFWRRMAREPSDRNFAYGRDGLVQSFCEQTVVPLCVRMTYFIETGNLVE